MLKNSFKGRCGGCAADVRPTGQASRSSRSCGRSGTRPLPARTGKDYEKATGVKVVVETTPWPDFRNQGLQGIHGQGLGL